MPFRMSNSTSQIDLVLTCEELLKSWPVRKLFGCLHIHHWYAIQELRQLYPNAPETLLPQWCKGGGDYTLVNYPENGKSDRAQRWIAKRYAKWWITDDYSTSGVNICNKINPLQVVSCYIIMTCCLLKCEAEVTKYEGNLHVWQSKYQIQVCMPVVWIMLDSKQNIPTGDQVSCIN